MRLYRPTKFKIVESYLKKIIAFSCKKKLTRIMKRVLAVLIPFCNFFVFATSPRPNNVWYSDSVQYWGDVVVSPGQPITVNCKMSAFDTYLWTLNGIPLPLEDAKLYYRQLKTQDNQRELRVTIHEATPEFNGDYRCNRFSRLYHRVTVRLDPNVKVDRVKNGTSYNQILILGESNTILCPVLTDESVPVSWFKNGHQVVPKTNIVTREKELTILNAQPSDSGRYICTVVSLRNLMETGHIIHLQYKAVVTPFVESSELALGDNFTVECTFFGYPVPKITWFIGNLEVTTSRRFVNRPIKLSSKKNVGSDEILSIADVTFEDANLYTCRAENALGSDETSTILRVVETNIVTNADKYSRELLFKVGHPLVLHCNVTDNPSWNVIWFKDDVQVQADPPKIYIFESNNTLVINDARDSVDAGEYMCVIPGHRTRKIISATIYARSKKLIPSGEESGGIVEMIHEEPLILQCNATNPKYDWEVVWYKDYVLQTNDHHVAINDYNNSLIIAHPRDEDPGEYMCVVKATKVDVLINATIHVRNKPRIKRFDERSWDLQEGDMLNIHCVIKTGMPTPSITWYKDGVLIQDLKEEENHFILLGDGTFADARLIVEEVVPLDRAVYTCKAQNWLGYDEVHLLIRVRATLAPLWPAIGIFLEFCVLFIVIAYDKKNRKKPPVRRQIRPVSVARSVIKTTN